ncbi:hypothetical protein ACFFTM_12585 [Pseudoduganella plicata]|uniref:Uncharacterized protein n=1 Tax=Pseudoduganella plicata TaxID=321984 RepID=A0A4P7BAZ0_9BURK|nr:hypothetical protein [Pseudoduganella plicata]QBQ35761.1 hypothetical protein E1742_05990 [Pseudoduganella plicata]GGY95300.1 hypothetical protein GCM10007388_30830 [Pseudoduganella plicata]
MDDTGLFPQLAGTLKGGVLLALLLHALALVPQWRARYFNPRFLNLTLTGLLLGVVHGCVIALAQRELAAGAGADVAVAWALAVAGTLNVAIAVQNLLAVHALVHLHRPSAIAAQRLRGAVTPMAWVSAGLAVVAYFAL